ncbi:MAG: tetraacyldisaccharide 4'-kinase [Bacteroidales bacterium]|nr:tetraacyldisaccharide 4'-kinase [Bacteroidales bacterium]
MVRRVRLVWWLYPVSLIYGIVVRVRNWMFDCGILHEQTFDVPIISVGNLTVGGTGKTPHTEYIVGILQERYQVAVLSRGYKRAGKGFLLARRDTTVGQLGDEPMQMKLKYPGAHVAVDADRCHGISQLCRKMVYPRTDVIVLDDAYQHRYVKPGLNLLLVNYNRFITKDLLIPAGRLREPVSETRRADVVVVTKCPRHLSPAEANMLRAWLKIPTYQHLFFSTYRYGAIVPLCPDGATQRPLAIDADTDVVLLTGIASARQLKEHLLTMTTRIHHLRFPDHHNYSTNDFHKLGAMFGRLSSSKKIILTTEKDAVKLATHPLLPEPLRQQIWIQPVEVEFLFDKASDFDKLIFNYVNQHVRYFGLTPIQP